MNLENSVKRIKNLKWRSIFKTSDADYGTKIKVIKQNEHKYPVSEMCKILQISRSGYYKYRDKDFSKKKMNIRISL